MKKRVELYKLIIESRKANEKSFFDLLEKEILLKDFLEYYYQDNIYKNISTNKSDGVLVDSENNMEQLISVGNKIDVKKKHLCYYLKNIEEADVTTSKDNRDKLRKVLIEYIKYDKKLKVVDKDTLEEQFEKSKNHGDLEKQHYLIETYTDTNKALIVWEKVLGAVTISLIEKELNSKYKSWIKEIYSNNDEKRKELLMYNLKIYAIPSKDFIEELMELDKISVLKVSVEKEEFTADEDIIFSEENVSRKEVELIYKPISGLSFSRKKVKQYVEGAIKGEKINRIEIGGYKNKNTITLNSEKIKMNEVIDLKQGLDGLVDSEELFEKFQNLIDDKYDYLSEIFIDIEQNEE
ncbi:hypothetical protein [Clostridium baratii]|uniref:hypothetical protein n=1 Tax=Clostridium baratii TaxID=1561 RepID=UPI0030D42959